MIKFLATCLLSMYLSFHNTFQTITDTVVHFPFVCFYPPPSCPSLFIQIFKYLTFDNSLNQLTSTLSNGAYDLLGFLVMFCIVYFAFAQLGYLAFSAKTVAYSSFTQTTYSLFRIMVGDIDFPSILQAHPVLGPIFFVTFIFFVFFVLLNMFLAIVDESYRATKAELIKQKNDLTLGHILKKVSVISIHIVPKPR
ncbi:unnamed protein product [Trichobilharzia regenti]|nr:unnamed protein product [Trichobilharzia regenti]